MTDTKTELIAQQYSQALIDLVQEGKLSYEQISSDLGKIKEVLDTSKDLDEFLLNPIISIEDKKEVIIKVFNEDINPLISNFLKVLIDKNRFDTFRQIITEYNIELDKINNISRVQVVSAVAMNDDSKGRLTETLSRKLGKQVILETEIDENIIAGLLVKIGDNIIDMSLRHKLEELGKAIAK